MDKIKREQAESPEDTEVDIETMLDIFGFKIQQKWWLTYMTGVKDIIISHKKCFVSKRNFSLFYAPIDYRFLLVYGTLLKLYNSVNLHPHQYTL